MRILFLLTGPEAPPDAPVAEITALCTAGFGDMRLCSGPDLLARAPLTAVIPDEADNALNEVGTTEDPGQLVLTQQEAVALDRAPDTANAVASRNAALQSLHARFPFEVLMTWGARPGLALIAAELGARVLTLSPGLSGPGCLPGVLLDPVLAEDGAAQSLMSRLTLSQITAITGGRGLASAPALMAWSDPAEAGPLEAQVQPLDLPLGSRLRAARGKIALIALDPTPDQDGDEMGTTGPLFDRLRTAVPLLIARGYTVAIRPSPSDDPTLPGVQTQLAELMAELTPFLSSLIWVDPQPGSDSALIAAADLVVSTGGPTGFLALLMDKPLVLLGPAAYGLPGVFPDLEQATSPAFDTATYKSAIGLLRRLVLDSQILPRSLLADRAWMGQRIATLVETASGENGQGQDAAAAIVARRLFDAFGPAERHRRRVLALEGSGTGVNAGSGSLFDSPTTPPPRRQSVKGWVSVPGLNPKIVPALCNRLWSVSRARTAADVILWLDQIWQDAGRGRALVTDFKLFDKNFYLKQAGDSRPAGTDPAEHFIQSGEAAHLSPNPSLMLDDYVRARSAGRTAGSVVSKTPLLAMLQEMVQSNADVLGQAHARMLPLDPTDTAAWDAMQTRIEALSEAPHSGARIAVVLHLAYADLAPRLLDALTMLPVPFDLFVTLPPWGTAAIEHAVQDRFPAAILWHYPQRGADVAPFLTLLPLLIARGYDAVLKLHSTRDLARAGTPELRHGTTVQTLALQALLGSPDRVRAILKAFAADPDLAMIGPAPLLVAEPEDADSSDAARALVSQFGMPAPRPEAPCLKGGFFWVQPRHLRGVAWPRLEPRSFEAEPFAAPGSLTEAASDSLSRSLLPNSHIGLVTPEGADVILGPGQAQDRDQLDKTLDAIGSDRALRTTLW